MLYTLELDVDSQKAKIKTFKNNAQIGDFIEIRVGIRKMTYGKNGRGCCRGSFCCRTDKTMIVI